MKIQIKDLMTGGKKTTTTFGLLHQIQSGLLLKESVPSLKLDKMHIVQWKSADPLFMAGFVACKTKVLL